MSFRWEDQDPGDEDPIEFTEGWAKRWLQWTLADRLAAELRAADPLQRPIVMECTVGTEVGE